MRLETTMSLSGPVPRSHSPLELVRLSTFIGGFPQSDGVAQPCGLFVSLGLDGGTEALAEVAQLGLGGGVLPRVGGHLSLMAVRAVDALQERQERRAENRVIVRAAE